jgi:hypothetical protein
MHVFVWGMFGLVGHSLKERYGGRKLQPISRWLPLVPTAKKRAGRAAAVP